MLTALELYKSVDWDRVNGHEETLAIIRTVNRLHEISDEDIRWHRDFNLDCYIILDDIDFSMYDIFKGYDRKDRR